MRRITLSSTATHELEKLLNAIGGQIEDREVVALVNRLESNPGQLRQLLEACEALDETSLKSSLRSCQVEHIRGFVRAQNAAGSAAPETAAPSQPASKPETPKKTQKTDSAAGDTGPAKDQPEEKPAQTEQKVENKPEPPKYKAMDDILTPNRNGFLDPQLDALYRKYHAQQLRKGLKPAVPEEWAAR